jgi:uncharacterized protein YecT (DUF1311 family)
MTTVLLLTANHLAKSQNDNESYWKDINKKAEVLRDELNKNEYHSEFEKLTCIDFIIDTFKIEQLLALKFENDYTTQGMSDAMIEAEKSYDVLLNKYYKILLNKLDEEEKETLKLAQRNWIAFRDSERKLYVTISLPKYSGGGTMYNLFVDDAYIDITGKRVIELYHHISSFFEYTY